MISLLPHSDRYPLAASQSHYSHQTYCPDQKYSTPTLYQALADSIPDSHLAYIDQTKPRLDFRNDLVEKLVKGAAGNLGQGNTHTEPESMRMQPDAWNTTNNGRYVHKRDLSTSSQASVGPVSPPSACSSFPQIVTTDSGINGHDETLSPDDQYEHRFTAKPMVNWHSCYQHGLDGSLPDMMSLVGRPGGFGKKRQLPVHNIGGRIEQADGASANPRFGTNSNSKRSGLTNINAPKLDRTMTDVYGDELYSPNFAITSTSPPPSALAASPTSSHDDQMIHMSDNDVFSQRISAANSHHLNVAHPPVSRNKSPFRTGSPLAPAMRGSQAEICAGFDSSQRVEERDATHREGLMNFGHGLGNVESGTSNTMSPQDATLEFSESDVDTAMPLFSPSTGFDGALETLHSAKNACLADTSSYSGTKIPSEPLAPASLSSHTAPGYGDIGDTNHHVVMDMGQDGSLDSPPVLDSSGSSPRRSRSKTPLGVDATRRYEGGTYTCTYHGCTMRFETPWLLQRHKREGHRQPQCLAPNSRDTSVATVFNTQAGPHRCDRINPSTGKSCNTAFSRPYDLTRHEDTIHNARKQKVRCDVCSEDKTFSRADALTRHYRVCHPNMALPGKHKRRSGL